MLRLVATSQGSDDPAAFHVGREHDGFEQQRDIWLADELVVEQEIPEFPASLGIIRGVIEPEFLNESPFSPTGASRVVVRPDDVHFDFAAGVSSQPGAVLTEHHLRPMPGRRQGRADSGGTPSSDQQVAFKVDQRHVRLALEPAIGQRRIHRGDLLEP